MREQAVNLSQWSPQTRARIEQLMSTGLPWWAAIQMTIAMRARYSKMNTSRADWVVTYINEYPSRRDGSHIAGKQRIERRRGGRLVA